MTWNKGVSPVVFFNRQRIGIDLGSSNTVIYIHRKGIALRQPSLLAWDKAEQSYLAYGQAALDLQGRAGERVDFIRPVDRGAIASFEHSKRLLAFFIKEATNRNIPAAEAVVAVPVKLSQVEKRAMTDALRDIGIRRAMLVTSPMAAAIGLGMDTNLARGRLLVDIGGASTDIGVISFGEVIESAKEPWAGCDMNAAIRSHVRNHYHLIISDQTAEALKLQIGNANFTHHDQMDRMRVKGRKLGSGVPEELEVHARLVARALDEVIVEIISGIKHVLQRIAPELSGDIASDGIYLTGGGALLTRLPERLELELGVPVHLVDQPLDTVALGAGFMLKNLSAASREAERQLRR